MISETETSRSSRQSDRAYNELRRMIIRTELKPGAPVEEAALMERLGIGRTPIREALQRLSQEYLIRSVVRRGFFVTETTAADLVNLFEIRQSLEGLAAYLAAQSATPEHHAAFDAILALGQQGVDENNEDMSWNIEVDERFHRAVADAADNRYLTTSIRQYYALSVRSLYQMRVQMTLVKDEIDNYRAVFAAIKAADPRLAEAAMRRHLSISPVWRFRFNAAAGWEGAPVAVASIGRQAQS